MGGLSQDIFSYVSLHSLVNRRGGVRRRRETDALVGGVEDRVEALQEGHAANEIKALTRRRANRVHDEVHVVHGAADRSVERPLQGGECHPTLRTGGETEKLTGQIWALAMSSKIEPETLKNKLPSFSY